MSRADVPEEQRSDFALYVDEFQNFSTDSFASILSEARKYRLNLIVANQFIGQLSNEIRDAVFGNIGTIVAHRMGYRPELTERPAFRAVAASFLECIWALLFPVFLLAGFRFGVFTATEAGAIVVLYALVIGVFVYRELTWAKLLAAMQDSVLDIGMVMLIIVMAAVLGHALTIEQAPRAITGFLADLPGDKYVTLLAVLGLLFVAGTVMEATVNVLLVTPLVLPALVHVGFDPVHMGVVMIVLVSVGGNTPPVGVIMYTVCGILKCSFGEFVRWSWPFVLAMLLLIAAMALVPEIVLFLPDHLM